MRTLYLLAALGAVYAQSIPVDTTYDAGLHVIVARGSGAPAGPGKMGSVAEKIVATVANSTIAPLDYPAAMASSAKDKEYLVSVVAGVASILNTIKAYSGKCPGIKMALLGHSQGSQVVSQTLCGTTKASIFNETRPLDLTVTRNVVGVILFGDPTHVANVSWNVGTSVENGVRDLAQPLEHPKALLLSTTRVFALQISPAVKYMLVECVFCDKGDPACDGGRDDAVHESYFAKYGKDAADFVVSKFKETMESR